MKTDYRTHGMDSYSSPYPELLREVAYGLGFLLSGALFGASAAYVYFGWALI